VTNTALDRRLFQSGLLVSAGLCAEVALTWSTSPLSFLAFLAFVCPVVVAGVLLFLWALVSNAQSS
jgi:hypothetical protein